MMSMAASGALANTIVFASWKGRPYVRERVIPSNPKSDPQTGRRAMFKFLSQAWSSIAAGNQAQFQDLADQIVASPFNAYLRYNLQAWHNFLPPTDEMPPAKIGTPTDNALDSAAWEENRIKLEISGSMENDKWGIVIFAKLAGAVTPAVGNTILVLPDTTVVTHYEYWTPPETGDWHFNSRTFADDGVMAAAGGAQNSGAP